jgi:hypothetical protein
VRIYDGHGRLLRPTNDGLWVGSAFSYYPPRARQIGLARVELVEPLRALLEGKETLADSERALAQIRRRFLHVVAVR